MNEVFRVELFNGKGVCCELDLPAGDYALLDALERLQMKPGNKPEWEIIEHNGFSFLHAHLTDECDLYQLNALSRRLEVPESEAEAFGRLDDFSSDVNSTRIEAVASSTKNLPRYIKHYSTSSYIFVTYKFHCQ